MRIFLFTHDANWCYCADPIHIPVSEIKWARKVGCACQCTHECMCVYIYIYILYMLNLLIYIFVCTCAIKVIKEVINAKEMEDIGFGRKGMWGWNDINTELLCDGSSKYLNIRKKYWSYHGIFADPIAMLIQHHNEVMGTNTPWMKLIFILLSIRVNIVWALMKRIVYPSKSKLEDRS